MDKILANNNNKNASLLYLFLFLFLLFLFTGIEANRFFRRAPLSSCPESNMSSELCDHSHVSTIIKKFNY